MSMTDPIADFLTRIRNGQRAGKAEVASPSSRSSWRWPAC
jgi:small subunit ribosomal protein S8